MSGDQCPTPGCTGDVRYAAPGRHHIAGCRYPVTADHTPERLDAEDADTLRAVIFRMAEDLNRVKVVCTQEHPPKMGSPTRDWPAGTQTRHSDGTRCVLLNDGDYAILAARLADQAARLAEQSETIVTLREGYREAVGAPPSEHQSRRLEAMATRIEELMAENAALRAALHPQGVDQERTSG